MGQANSVPTLNNELFTDFGRCATSEIFELVAADNTRFFIHKDILTFQSQPFQEAVEGGRKEATERKIDLKDWDRDTIARLVQFLYTGDYQYPDPVLISPAPEAASAADKQVVPQPQSEEFTSPLDEFQIDFPRPPKRHLLDTERSRGSKGAKCDYRDALLSHAGIYALACYKSIPGLQCLSLNRLMPILSSMEPIELGSHVGRNIVDLARYTYANTTCRIDSKDPLRFFISHFIADNFTRWQTEPAAVELMCEGGDLVRDVMAAVSMKIADDIKPPRVIHSQVAQPQVAQPQVAPKTGFISKLNVVRGITGQSPPAGYVEALHEKDSSLNYPHSSPAWFVPEYTTKKQYACTKFQAPVTHPSRFLRDISGANFGSIRYLEEVKDQSVAEKITEVALVRGDAGVLDLASLVGYRGMSTNIGRDGVLLYLVWKSVKVS